MIVYYKKSDGMIMAICPDRSKKHLTDEGLENELEQKFPNDIGDMAVTRFKEKEKQIVSLGGTWDNDKKEMSEPPKPIEPTPEQERMAELKEKFEDQSATMAEVQEYLHLLG